MTLGALLRTARRRPASERREAIPPVVSEQFWWPHFHPSTPLPSRTSPLDAQSPMEEERSFRAFDVTNWAPRIWDEGVSGVFLDLRGAYNYWQRADDQAQLPFEC
ncbi:putative surface protease GP63 [Trypanosoma cruzi]|nr:putative surface protease GP63 [Trypanosoma cruzi]